MADNESGAAEKPRKVDAAGEDPEELPDAGVPVGKAAGAGGKGGSDEEMDSGHRGAKVSKPEPNHANHPKQFSGQNPNFRNVLRGFDRHEEHHLKGYARTGISKILPF